VIKLLIVEDDANKREQLHNLVADRFPALTVTDAESLIGGVRQLRHWNPDIVILDMTLPNYDPEDESNTGGMEAFGGEEFLRQVKRFQLSPSVIVVTQFETFGDIGESKGREELHSYLDQSFPETYRGMVYYHASLNTWSDELEKLVRDALRSIVDQ
jgi:CheY-like chemotaxis protein